MSANSKPNLSTRERQDVVLFMLFHSLRGVPDRGAMKEAAISFGVDKSTVSRIWGRFQETRADEGISGVVSRKPGVCGRHKIDRDALLERIGALPLRRRMTQRCIAEELSISRSVIQDALKQGDLLRHTSTIHPLLTAANKRARLRHAVRNVVHGPGTSHSSSMYNVVHVDEKWFNEDKDQKVFYILPGVTIPHRERKSKRFIGKSMFLAAVARPRFDNNRQVTFDGKIGIWDFTRKVTAQRASRNRLAGTIETKNLDTVNREVYKRYLLQHVITSIKAKWPRAEQHQPIYIQQDNATPHVPVDDPDVVEAGSADGWDIRLMFQPPNSPDMNVLDLGYFSSIQALQYQEDCYNIDELIIAVKKSYDALIATKLDNIFLTLQKVMECVMRVDGGNDYKLPHMHKDTMRKKGRLPKVVDCDPELYRRAVVAIHDGVVIDLYI